MRDTMKLVLILLGSMLLSVSSAQTLKEGLVGYWNFDRTLKDLAAGNPASRAADDGRFYDVGGGTPGEKHTETTPAYTEDAVSGWAINFSEQNGYLRVESSPDIFCQAGAEMTFSLWVKVLAVKNPWQPFASMADADQYKLHRVGDTEFVGAVLGRRNLNGSTTSVLDGQWHHLVITAGPNNQTNLYVDGEWALKRAAADFKLQLKEMAHIEYLYVGGNPHRAGGADWEWMADEMGLWKRALSAEEVKRLYETNDPGYLVGVTNAMAPGLAKSWSARGAKLLIGTEESQKLWQARGASILANNLRDLSIALQKSMGQEGDAFVKVEFGKQYPVPRYLKSESKVVFPYPYLDSLLKEAGGKKFKEGQEIPFEMAQLLAVGGWEKNRGLGINYQPLGGEDERRTPDYWQRAFASAAAALLPKGVSGQARHKERLLRLFNAYRQNEEHTWHRAFTSRRSAVGGGAELSDLMAGFLLQICEDYNGASTLQEIGRHLPMVGAIRNLKHRSKARDNFGLAVFLGVKENLTKKFKLDYKWPVSSRVESQFRRLSRRSRR